MSRLFKILIEANPEKTLDIIKFSIFIFISVIVITICICSIRYKGFKYGYAITILLLLFFIWLAYNTISSTILDFIFLFNYL